MPGRTRFDAADCAGDRWTVLPSNRVLEACRIAGPLAGASSRARIPTPVFPRRCFVTLCSPEAVEGAYFLRCGQALWRRPPLAQPTSCWPSCLDTRGTFGAGPRTTRDSSAGIERIRRQPSSRAGTANYRAAKLTAMSPHTTANAMVIARPSYLPHRGDTTLPVFCVPGGLRMTSVGGMVQTAYTDSPRPPTNSVGRVIHGPLLESWPATLNKRRLDER